MLQVALLGDASATLSDADVKDAWVSPSRAAWKASISKSHAGGHEEASLCVPSSPAEAVAMACRVSSGLAGVASAEMHASEILDERARLGMVLNMVLTHPHTHTHP